MPCVYTAKLDVLALARSSENLASSAVNSLPSLNFTPLRKLRRSCVGLTSLHSVASEGSGLKVLLLYSTSVSYTAPCMVLFTPTFWVWMSQVEISTDRDQRKVLACAASGSAVARAAASKSVLKRMGNHSRSVSPPLWRKSLLRVTNLSFLA